MLSALSGCKMLRELSRWEIETESKLSMKELAQKFENLAHGETMNTSSNLCSIKQKITDKKRVEMMIRHYIYCPN